MDKRVNVKENSKLKKQNIYLLLIFVILAFFPLFICSKCSPLYPFNDWYDINMFFTLGKGMLRGKVLYRDLIEQKGPFLFALYAVGYLIDHTGFLGVFIFECISMIISQIYIYKILGLYVENSRKYIWLFPVFCAGIVGTKCFVHGGSVEEFVIPFYLYGMYSLLKIIRKKNVEIDKKFFLINGILIGILFWTKYTVLGFFIGWCIIVFLIMVSSKQYKKLCSGIFFFGVGGICSTIPWIVYFGLNHAIKPWIRFYFLNNIFNYTSDVSGGIWSRISNALRMGTIAALDKGNRFFSIIVILGIVIFMAIPKSRISLIEKLSVIVLLFLSILGIFIGGVTIDYYILPISAFAVFLFVSVAVLLDTVFISKDSIVLISTAIILVISCFFDTKISPNIYLLQYSKEDMAQFRFAKIIKESDDWSLLNYGFLDGGFYTTLNTIPDVPYYCTLNANYQQTVLEQQKYLRAKQTNWVVTWRECAVTREELENTQILSEYYELVDYVIFPIENADRTYALFRRKSIE